MACPEETGHWAFGHNPPCRAVLLSADAFRASLTGLSQFLLATIEEAWRWACLSTSQFLLAITEEARRWALNSFHLTGGILF